MKKEEFQNEIKEGIVQRMDDEGVDVERMQELARRALELGEEHGEEIPDDQVENLKKEFDEVLNEKEGESPDAEMRGAMGMRR